MCADFAVGQLHADEQVSKEYQQQEYQQQLNLYPVQNCYGLGQDPLPTSDMNGMLQHRASLPGFFPHNYNEKSMDLCSPGAHHRNSIAGSTVPRPMQRLRKGGPLVISSDGPYFSNTTQFYNVFSFNQAESYKLKVMARIEKGFFMTRDIWTCYRRNYFQISTAFCILGFDHSQFSEVPCLIELPDPLPADFSEEVRQQQDFAMSQAADEQRQLYRIKKEAYDESFESMPENYMGTDSTTGMDATGSSLRMTAAAACSASVTEQHSSMPPISGPTRLALVTHFSISISSKIASTSTRIGLIQHTPKRDKGPQYVPSRREIRGGGNFALPATTCNQSIATFERVQFKTATANNGKRRATQQFYILMVDLFAHTQDGRIIRVAASQSDALVVRGRSPGHYTENSEGELILSPTSNAFRERRHSSISSHSSSHPYHSNGHYSGTQSRNHSIGAGASVSIKMSTLNLGLSTAADGSRSGGPLSPISPGGTGMGFSADYSPGTAGSVVAAQSFHSNQATVHQNWTDASSMSSPASTYDGSAFSSPTMAYPAFQQYQNGNNGHQQPSPQENGYHHHAQTSYFAQRPSSFGSIPRMMMVGTPGAGVSPGCHSFDSRLETTLENSYETDGCGQDSTGYQQQQQQGSFESPAATAGSHALYTSAAGSNNSQGYSGLGVGYQQQQQHTSVSMLQAGSGAFSGQVGGGGEGMTQFSLIKSEPDENPHASSSSSASAPIFMHHPTSNHFGHSDLNNVSTPTATATTSSSASSSFGYNLNDLVGGNGAGGPGNQQSSNTGPHHQYHTYLPSVALNNSNSNNNSYDDPYDLNSYAADGDNSNSNKNTSSGVPGYHSLNSVKVEPEY
ncbi:meiosis-specific transcription factor ndt80 [Linnemannia gamsii]|uniref:Meiosis-specific transcription factor ndt80 n=1 Tax=Linnemannia gamsii TaxID=64522 RepID=A0ABQ7JTB9_9FUNG|nr:meiosis-specific transcription factor ndt80 [Linnemannia gamsii]